MRLRRSRTFAQRHRSRQKYKLCKVAEHRKMGNVSLPIFDVALFFCVSFMTYYYLFISNLQSFNQYNIRLFTAKRFSVGGWI